MPARRSRRPHISSPPRSRLIRTVILLLLISPLVDLTSLRGSNAGAVPVRPDSLVDSRAIGPTCGIDDSNETFSVEVCIEIAGSETLSGDITVTMAVAPVSGTVPSLRNVGGQISAASAAPPNFSSILQDYAEPWTFTLPTYRWKDGSYLIRARAQYPDKIVNGERFPVYAVSPAIAVKFANGVTAAPRSQGTWRPTTGTPGSPLVVAAVGDGAGGLPEAMDVANLIDGWDPNMLLYLGDVYNAGKYTEFYNYYEPTLGRFKAITNPVPGNHEGGGDQFHGYRDYWDLDLDYYSVDAGGWHLIALNSDERFGQYGPGSNQYEWLKQDLAANGNPCTIAFFHHGRFSGGGEAGDARMDPIWRLLVEQGVDVVLNGHAHNYQRWTPLNGDGVANSEGTTQFIVGTGGHIPFQTVGNNPLLAGKAGGVSGALRLELTPGHASFGFVTTAGAVADTGEISCAPPPAETAVVLAAGDIAHCPDDAKDEETGALVASQPGTVLALGDLAYDNGTAEEFANCYDPSWGSFKDRTYPVPGNHEYQTPGATGYFGYFGDRAGDPTKGYYSFDLGEWHIVALNSNCLDIVDPTSPTNACAAGSTQEQWLRADLAANPNTCILAFWHNARFSSGRHPNYDLVSDLWQALADYGAEIVLSGHNHHYERFAPQDVDGNLDPNGIRQFVVGTGGKDFYPLPGGQVLQPNSEARQESSFGVLRLELQPTGYTWEFLPIAGSTYADTGSATCSGAPVEPPPPVTNVELPARAAFYYPWYPENWTGSGGVNPYTQYEPSLGYYDLDPTEVSAHIDQLRYGNIDVGIASWWGPGHHTDQQIPLLLERAEGTGFKWAFYHEWGSATPPTAEQIEANINYLVDTYGAHDSVAKIDGRVVIFVTRVSTCENAQRWLEANTANAYLVLKVFGGYGSCAFNPDGRQPDGWHQYAPGSATDQQGDFSFSISPGLYRASDQFPTLARDQERWASNVRAMIASEADWQLITTFNQWSDGSSIESATAWESASGYGVYLDILHSDGVVVDPPTVTPTSTATAVVEPVTNVSFPARATLYYPWYPGNWTSGSGVYPNSHYEPALGYYDLDPADISAHVDQMQYGGIDVGIASWRGVGSPEDQKIPLLLTQAKGTGFKWAFYYEPEGFGNPTVAQLRADIDYLVTTYGNHEAVAKIDGRIVIFVFNADDTTCEVLTRWSNASTANAYLVMKVFGGYRSCSPQPDGWHQNAPASATDSQGSYSYSISPGFHHRAESMPRLERDPARWAQNVQSMIASGAAWQLITSFNNWADGSGVESATAWPSASGYGVFLDILHNDGQIVDPPTVTPVPTETPIPSDTPTPTSTPEPTATFTATSQPSSNVTLPARAAFYYSAYPASWSAGGPFPNSRYEPMLGYYDLDGTDVAAHIDQMQYGGIDVGIAIWNGQGSAEDQKIPLLLSQAQGTGFKWAFSYQAEASRNPTVAELQADIDYLVSTYGASESVARVNGRVVIFVHNVNDSTCEVVDRWKSANTSNAYLVMKVFGGYRGCNQQPDGWHQFGPATAADRQRDYSYTISPGYFRVTDQNPVLPRDPERWAGNVRAMVASGEPWQLVTTFNKWSDGTGVESTTAWASPSGYGVYLDILHADGQTVTPATATPTATATMTAAATMTATSVATVTPTSTPVATATASATLSPTSTVTPTSTATITSTPSPTATSTATPVPTATVTPTPVPTATIPVGPLTFTPVADARVERDNPGANFGSTTTMITDNSPMTEAYLLFDVNGLTGPVQAAKLRLWVVDPASNAPPISTCGNTTWSESALTWNNRPAVIGSRDDKGAVNSGIWLEYDVTPWVTGNDPLCLALIPQSSNGLDLSSKEGSTPPQLIINGAPALTVASSAQIAPDTDETAAGLAYPVAQTSRSTSTVAGTLAIDGDPATVWQTADGIDPGRVAVLTLDLGDPVAVHHVRILTGPAGLTGTVTIETSNDGVSWSYFGIPNSTGARTWIDVTRDSGLSDPVTARYVRIVCVTTGAETSLGGIAEVEVLPPG